MSVCVFIHSAVLCLATHNAGMANSKAKPSTDESAVAALPRIIFNKVVLASTNKVNQTEIINTTCSSSAPSVAKAAATVVPDMTLCAICRDDFVDGDVVTRLPCGHSFHMGGSDEDTKSVPEAAAEHDEPL